jgi:hypothetical protein
LSMWQDLARHSMSMTIQVTRHAIGLLSSSHLPLLCFVIRF